MRYSRLIQHCDSWTSEARIKTSSRMFFCAFHAVGHHAATAIRCYSNGSYLSTSAVVLRVARGPFNPVKELWIPSHTGSTNIPPAFPALELLAVGWEEAFAIDFSGMLTSREGEVSPRILTTETRRHLNHVLVAEPATVVHDGANTGRRSELLGELGDMMGLSEICETKLREWWLSWRRDPSEHQASSW